MYPQMYLLSLTCYFNMRYKRHFMIHVLLSIFGGLSYLASFAFLLSGCF